LGVGKVRIQQRVRGLRSSNPKVRFQKETQSWKLGPKKRAERKRSHTTYGAEEGQCTGILQRRWPFLYSSPITHKIPFLFARSLLQAKPTQNNW